MIEYTSDVSCVTLTKPVMVLFGDGNHYQNYHPFGKPVRCDDNVPSDLNMMMMKSTVQIRRNPQRERPVSITAFFQVSKAVNDEFIVHVNVAV